MIRARPTTYKGIQMRSRLEAGYAAHFDQLGVQWEYEPECFADETGQYLPDFRIRRGPGHEDCYIEAKPPLGDTALRDVARRMGIIWSSNPEAELEIVMSNGDAVSGILMKRSELPPIRVWQLWRTGDTEHPSWQWLIGVTGVDDPDSGSDITELPDGSFLVQRKRAV